jgi:hypothetical protein
MAVNNLIILNISIILRLMLLQVYLWKQIFLILSISANMKGIRSIHFEHRSNIMHLWIKRLSMQLTGYLLHKSLRTNRMAQCHFSWFVLRKCNGSNLDLRTDCRKIFVVFWSSSTRISCLFWHHQYSWYKIAYFFFSLSKRYKLQCVILRTKCK